jgi:2-polyprenyl-3-methyl-5-hydroxy-6-metoxy-1,4-benzoquinol methylase
MISTRKLEAELLDELPASAPEAVHSRGDLRRLNALMGSVRILARTAQDLRVPPPNTVVELACGDGELVLKLLRRQGWRPQRLILIDQQPVVSEETQRSLGQHAEGVEIVKADVFAWLQETGRERVDVITTNLFLHHLPDERLGVLLGLIAAKANAFIACEPRRSAFALLNARLVGLIGCNHVTRHDAVVSVQAGFAGNELERLWPQDAAWQRIETASGLFSHRFGTVRAGSRRA